MSLEHPPYFSISIVSHGHRDLILSLLGDLKCLGRCDFEVILTWNLGSEESIIDANDLPFRVINIVNPSPKGFAANHNMAFRHSSADNFVILNPDIRLPEDPFNALLPVLRDIPDSICAPLILNTDHEREDSARFFPSPMTLLKKAAAKICGIRLSLQEIPGRQHFLTPDWIAGMFIVIPRAVYCELGGLSERYFLYYEDVDFCARAQLRGIAILVVKDAYAVHDARRESHRSIRFLAWHMASAFRFFTSPAYLRLWLRKSPLRNSSVQ